MGTTTKVKQQRKWILRTVLILLVLTLIPVTSGILANDGFTEVSTPQDLFDIRNNPGGSYKLVNDIDLASWGQWNPIGSNTSQFTGKLDGQGYTISNLTITDPDYGQAYAAGTGLFGFVGNNGQIYNLNLVDVDIDMRSSSLGAVVGVNRGKIENVFVSGTVIQRNAVDGGNRHSVGAVVGRNAGTSGLYNVGAVADVSTELRNVGGLVGYMHGGNIVNSYSIGDVHGHGNYVGGLVGATDASTAISSVTITDSYSAGAVTTNQTGSGLSVGGLVGDPTDATITRSYWDTSLTTRGGAGIGRTTSQMQQQSTFSGWDFNNTWFIVNGSSYPVLQSGEAQHPVLTLNTDPVVVADGTVVNVDLNGEVTNLVAGDDVYLKYTLYNAAGAPLATHQSQVAEAFLDVAGTSLNVSETLTLNALADGAYTLGVYVKAVGATGVSTEVELPVFVNVPYITVELKTADEAAYELGQWTNQAVTALLGFGNDLEEEREYALTAPSATPSSWTEVGSLTEVVIDESGEYALHVRTANADDDTLTVVSTIRIDLEDPNVSINPDGSTDWFSSADTVQVTVADALSGLDANSLSYAWTESATVPTSGWESFSVNGAGEADLAHPEVNGEFYLHVRVADEAGNEVTLSSNSFQLDGAAPVVTFDPNGVTEWGTSFSVEVEVTDEHSGVDVDNLAYIWTTSADVPSNGFMPFALTEGKAVLNSPEEFSGVYYLHVLAGDLAGNEAVTSSAAFSLDNDPADVPQIVVPDGWVNESVTVSITAGEDEHSGTATTEYRTQGADDADWSEWTVYTEPFEVTANGVTTIEARSTDELGHVSEIAQAVVQIENRAPELSLQGAAEVNVYLGADFNDPGVTADHPQFGDLSAEVVVSGEVNTSEVGDYELTYTVTDPAGNTASVTRVVRVVDQRVELNEETVVQPGLWTIEGFNGHVVMPEDLPAGTTVVVELGDVDADVLKEQGLSLAGEALTFTFTFPGDVGPDGSFVLTLAYAADADVDSIGIYYLNEETGEWEHRGGDVNVAEQTISLRVPHFSTYAVLEASEDDSTGGTDTDDEGTEEDEDGDQLPATASGKFVWMLVGLMTLLGGIALYVMIHVRRIRAE